MRRVAGKMIIREEKDTDRDQIWQLNAEAFETEAEANLIYTLRDSGVSHISLVAEEDKKIVGHIFFTPVALIGLKVLREGALDGRSGIVRYHPAFKTE